MYYVYKTKQFKRAGIGTGLYSTSTRSSHPRGSSKGVSAGSIHESRRSKGQSQDLNRPTEACWIMSKPPKNPFLIIRGLFKRMHPLLKILLALIAASLFITFYCGRSPSDITLKYKYDFRELYSRQNFTILANFFEALDPAGGGSITYTTHSQVHDLRQFLPQLIEGWTGPVSLAVYAPGHDFSQAVLEIEFLRRCTVPGIKSRVTFHIFFEKEHSPTPEDFGRLPENVADCLSPPPIIPKLAYGALNMLKYPINLARNIAREQAKTDFVLSSEIHLIPHPKTLAELSLPEELESVFMIPVQDEPLNSVKISFRKLDSKKLGTLKEDIYFIGRREGIPYDETIFSDSLIHHTSIVHKYCVLNFKFYVLDGAFLLQKTKIDSTFEAYRYSPEDRANYVKELESKYLRLLGNNGTITECAMIQSVR